MARFDGGWVKIHRKAVLGDIGSNYIRGGLFQTLIVIANIQDSTVSWNGKPRRLQRGEVATSLKELADLGEVDRSTVLRHLNYLEMRGTLTVEKSNRGVLIKLLNYERYQSKDADGPHQHQHQAPHQTHIGPTHIEELKNIRKKELEDSKESSTAVLIQSSHRQQKKSLTDSFIPKNPEDLFSGMPADTMARWAALYPDHGFISREVVKAIGWYGINPKKQPRSRRGWILAISSWLERSWRMTQVTTKGAGRPPSRGIEEILNDDQINANQSQFKLVSVGEK